MRHGGIDRDHQIQIGHQPGRIGEISHLPHEIGHPGRRPILLQTEKPQPIHPEQRRQPIRTQRPLSVANHLRIARPRHPDPGPPIPHGPQTRAPSRRQPHIRTQRSRRNRLQRRSQRQRQALHRAVQIERRQRLPTRHDPIHSRQIPQQPDQRRLHLHDDPQSSGGGQRRVTAELQRVAQPLFGMDQQRAAPARLTEPLRLHKRSASPGHIRRFPAPFVFPPPLRHVTHGQQRHGQIAMRIRKIQLQADGRPEAGERRLRQPLFLQDGPEIVVCPRRVGPKHHRLPATGGRLVQPALLRQHGTQRVMRLHQVGPQRDRPMAATGRLLQLSQPTERNAKIVRRLGEIRLGREGRPVANNRFLQRARVLQRGAQVVARIRITRPKGNGAPIAGGRLVQLPLVHKQIAQVIIGFGKIRLHGDGLAQPTQRLVYLVQRMQRGGQVTVSLGVARPQDDRSAIAGDGLVQPAQRLQRITPVGVIQGDRGVDPDRLADQVNGQLGPPGLKRDDTQQVQAVGVAGVHRQDLTVQTFGVGQVPGLVMLNGGGEHRFAGGRQFARLRLRQLRDRPVRGSTHPIISLKRGRPGRNANRA